MPAPERDCRTRILWMTKNWKDWPKNWGCEDEERMRKSDVIAKLQEFPYDPKEYWVVAGAAMVLYGIREECTDIDLGCTSKLADRLEEEGYLFKTGPDGSRCFRIGGDVEIFENWLRDSITHVEGIPVVSLNGLIEMKQELGREKDLRDIRLILAYMQRELTGDQQ